MALSVLAILALTLVPGREASGPATGRSLVPFEDLLRSFDPQMPDPGYARDLAVGNLLANVVLFLPFGVALGLRCPDAPRVRLVLTCLGLSLLVEGVQLVWSVGRSADITDVLMNTLGGFLGLLLAKLTMDSVRHRRRSASAR